MHATTTIRWTIWLSTTKRNFLEELYELLSPPMVAVVNMPAVKISPNWLPLAQDMMALKSHIPFKLSLVAKVYGMDWENKSSVKSLMLLQKVNLSLVLPLRQPLWVPCVPGHLN